MSKLAFICPVCNKEKLYYPSTIPKVACSKECLRVIQSQKMSGEGNPNYGKFWDAEKKKQQSKLVSSKMQCETVKKAAGSANRGKKFNPDRVKKMHGHRTKDSYSRIHTEETKQKIGLLSSEKWTEEFKQKFKKRMIENGQWISEADKTDYEIYAALSNWVKPMWNLFESVEGGVFNAKTNPKGSVRDHILSRMDGFDMHIWPELMRHPVNCQIIRHSRNASKRRKSEQSYEELKQKIIEYNKDWFEQDICLQRLKEYDAGNKWHRTD
jgi:hypothetical protein